MLNHTKIVDIYDADGEYLGATNCVREALFLADMHGGCIQRRPIKHARFATDIVVSEQQRVRSQLRKIVHSGKLTRKQICSVMDCDEYRLIDMISEVGRHNFGVRPDTFKVSLLETCIRAKVEGVRSMRKPIPLTASASSTGISPQHQRFLASLDRAIKNTLASGKIKIRPHGVHTAAPPQPEPAPVAAPAPVFQNLPPRTAPPPRPAFKRPTALK